MAGSWISPAALTRIARPVLVGALGLAVLALVLLGMQIQTALTQLRSEASDNLYWNLSQLEVDLLRLREEMVYDIAHPEASLKELRKRYDLLYSRAQNAIGGKSLAWTELKDLSDVMMATLQTFLDTETPLIDSDDATLRQALPAMADRLGFLRERVRQTSIHMVDRMAKLADDRRAAFETLVHQMAMATATSIALLAGFLLLALRLNRQAKVEALHTARVSRRLASAIDSALDAIIVVDLAGRIIQYNPSAEQIFGYRREQAIGQDLGSLIIPQDLRAAHAGGMARMRAGGTFKMVNAGRFQTTALNRAGREFPVELSISSADGEDGTIFIAFLRDISDRLEAEANLTRARDEALTAERSKTEFMAVMSHEMRTPLNGVLASLEIAWRKADDPEQRRFIELAQGSARQLLRHANDVLDITRLDSGGLTLDQQDFDLKAHVAGLVEASRPVCAAKGIGLHFHMLSETMALSGDPFRIGQIVQNFLSNAIKFTEQGGVTVEVEVVDALLDTRTIQIRVIDTGPGIAGADQERIFENFVTLDPSFNRSGGGAGLGLAISRRLASAMGGEVGVESVEGEGSCFWLQLSLPLARDISPVSDQEAAEMPLPAQDVLVVEDNATNRAVLEEMLRHLGQRVVMASDGASGAAKAMERRFDLILMDISMPVMDGLEATGLIRKGGASQGARIVAVTAHSMPADLNRFRAAGMDDVLVKPISNRGLIDLLSGRSGKTEVPGEALVDRERLDDLRAAVGAQGFARLAATFLRDGAAQKDRILSALTRETTEAELAALCHEAAGVAVVFGAQRLGSHYRQAEHQAQAGQADLARQALGRTTALLWQETEAAITALL